MKRSHANLVLQVDVGSFLDQEDETVHCARAIGGGDLRVGSVSARNQYLGWGGGGGGEIHVS